MGNLPTLANAFKPRSLGYIGGGGSVGLGLQFGLHMGSDGGVGSGSGVQMGAGSGSGAGVGAAMTGGWAGILRVGAFFLGAGFFLEPASSWRSPCSRRTPFSFWRASFWRPSSWLTPAFWPVSSWGPVSWRASSSP